MKLISDARKGSMHLLFILILLKDLFFIKLTLYYSLLCKLLCHKNEFIQNQDPSLDNSILYAMN